MVGKESNTPLPGDRLAEAIDCDPAELRAAFDRLGELAASPSDGKLTAQGKTLCEMFNALRQVWPEPFALEYEQKMLAAIDAQDQPRMARELLDFIGWSGGHALLERVERQRDQQRRGALKAAANKRGRPSPGARRLNEYRKSTKTEPTKATKVLADDLALSPSHLRRLLKRKR